MASQVSGKLTSATSKQPSFAGFRVEALFDRKSAPAHSRSSTTTQVDAGFEGDATTALVESDYGTAAKASVPFRVSAVSDAAGNFTLAFPDQQELAGTTVRFVVSSPAGRIVRELDVESTDLAYPVTISVEASGSTTVDEPAPIVTPEGAAVDALFRSNTAMRHAITQNLRSRRGDSEAVDARVDKAWRFNPSELSTEALAERHYVAPGADPAPMVETVLMRRVDALRSDGTKRTLILRKSAELTRLMEEPPDTANALEGVVGLGPLMDFISSRSTGSSLVTEPAYTLCKAEMQADTLLAAVERNGGQPTGDGAAIVEDSTAETRGADELVTHAVNLQMKPATAPESQLAYGKIANSAGEDTVQRGILQTFQLRPGASDVTSYHDFHTLQIAFEHVWTQVFDGQLSALGRDLYREYVKLKDFSGSTAPDLQVGTLADLRRLMDEVKKLSQVVKEDIPADLRGGDSTDGNAKSSDDVLETASDVLETAGRVGLAAATGGLSEIAMLIFKELGNAGTKPVLNWSQIDSRGLPLPNGYGTIIASFSNNAESGLVQMRLETKESRLKIMEFQPWSSSQGRFLNHSHGNNPKNLVSNQGHPRGYTSPWITLPADAVRSGVIEFASEQSPGLNMGRYVLAGLEEKLTKGWQVTFLWTD